MNIDRISEEAHSEILSLITESDALNELGLDSLPVDLFFDQSSYETYDLTPFTETITNSVEPGELNVYLGPNNSQCSAFVYDNHRALINTSPIQSTPTDRFVQVLSKQVELSQSVDVGQPQQLTNPSQMLSIVNPLEETYRPRYKSDYFTLNGKIRKPRYVADRCGGHCITLKVRPNTRGMIRIDWLTIPTKSGDRYSMPYRFQQSNTSMDIPDCNPLFIHINADRTGMMKLYLVLIKAKQDELKLRQPLQPFHPYKDAFGIPDKMGSKQIKYMNPKELIQYYQLDKSQLAFTYCAYGKDETPCIPQWDTTVYSTILTELPPEASKNKNVACPNCQHVFQLPSSGNSGEDEDEIDGGVQEIVPMKRKANHYAGQEPTIKQRKSISNEFMIFQ